MPRRSRLIPQSQVAQTGRRARRARRAGRVCGRRGHSGRRLGPRDTDVAAAGHDPLFEPVRAGDFFITPTGDTTTYANGPEILDGKGNVVWFHADARRPDRRGLPRPDLHGQPVLTWWQGTGLGGISSGTDYIDNDQYQQIATVKAGNGLSADGHEFLITPQNTALILSYDDDDRKPDLDRRPGRPDGHRRRRAGDRHRDRQGAIPVEQRGPRPFSAERAAAASIGEHAVGLVPHQRREARHRRQPADRRPRHLDGLQGQSLQRRTSSGSSAARTAASPCRPRLARRSTARARSSPGSTIPEALGQRRCTRSSTTSPPARRCCPTAGR